MMQMLLEQTNGHGVDHKKKTKKKAFSSSSPTKEIENKTKIFKGSTLVSALLDIDDKRFPTRSTALDFARRLFRLGLVRSIFGASNFEDSVQLYTWHNGDDLEQISNANRRNCRGCSVCSHCRSRARFNKGMTKNLPAFSWSTSSQNTDNQYYRNLQNPSDNRVNVNAQFLEDVRNKLLSIGGVTSSNSLTDTCGDPHTKAYSGYPSNIQSNPKSISVQHTKDIQHSTNLKATHTTHSPLRPKFKNCCTTNSIKMDSGVKTDKYLSEKHLFPMDYNAPMKIPQEMPKNLETQVFRACVDDCELTAYKKHSICNNNTIANTNTTTATGTTTTTTTTTAFTSHSHHSHHNRNNDHNNNNKNVSNSCFDVVTNGNQSQNGMKNWGCADPCSSYSDNEKQLMEEMNRMKKEHQRVLRTYEDRISKLTTKMHELHNIAEMLENSSNKSVTYGILPGKALQQQQHQQQQQQNTTTRHTLQANDATVDGEVPPSYGVSHTTTPSPPPPLPPRSDQQIKGSDSSKPMHSAKVKLVQLPWQKIVTNPDNNNSKSVVWNTLVETEIDASEIDRLFEKPAQKIPSSIQNLYDDICHRCRTRKSHLSSTLDPVKNQEMVLRMKQIKCSYGDIVQALLTLSIETVRFANPISLAELFHLMSRDSEQINRRDRQMSNSPINCSDYLMSELSSMELLRERLDFLRFKLRLLTEMFETDQRLRAVHAACDELYNSLPLKNLLSAIVSIGNHLNRGSCLGQANGFQLDILSHLKDIFAKFNKRNLLEHIVMVYCQTYENTPDFYSMKEFPFPNPAMLRQASQVSFDDMTKSLYSWKNELINMRNKIHSGLLQSNNSKQLENFQTAVERFLMAALETLDEQKKFLQDTKSYSSKTQIYFSFENNSKESAHVFFSLWFQFLQECKRYWKIAHHRLAEERFRQDMNQKIKLISGNRLTRVPQYHSGPDLPPRSRKTKEQLENAPSIPPKNWEDSGEEACLSSDNASNRFHNLLPKLSKADRLSHPHQHIHANPSAMHLKTFKSRDDLHEIPPQSPPKALTSRPPNTSDIHKPKAMNPQPNGYEVSPSRVGGNQIIANSIVHNYINQSPIGSSHGLHMNTAPTEITNDNLKDAYSSQVMSPMSTAEVPTANSEPFLKRSTQHLFKSWLKREQTKQNSTEHIQVNTKLNADKTKTMTFKSIQPTQSGNTGEETVRAPKIYTKCRDSKTLSTGPVPTSVNQEQIQANTNFTTVSSKSNSQQALPNEKHPSSSSHQDHLYQLHQVSNHSTKTAPSKEINLGYERNSLTNNHALPAEARIENCVKSPHNGPLVHPHKSCPDVGRKTRNEGKTNLNYQNENELVSTTKQFVDNHEAFNSGRPNDRTLTSVDKDINSFENPHLDLYGVDDKVNSNWLKSAPAPSKSLPYTTASNQQLHSQHHHHHHQQQQSQQKKNQDSWMNVGNSGQSFGIGSYAQELQSKSRKYFTTNSNHLSTVNNISGITVSKNSQSKNWISSLTHSKVPLINTVSSNGKYRSSSAYNYSQKMIRDGANQTRDIHPDDSSRTRNSDPSERISRQRTPNEKIPLSAPSISSLIERFEKAKDTCEIATPSRSNEPVSSDAKQVTSAPSVVSSRRNLFPSTTAISKPTTSTPISLPLKMADYYENASSDEEEHALRFNHHNDPSFIAAGESPHSYPTTHQYSDGYDRFNKRASSFPESVTHNTKINKMESQSKLDMIPNHITADNAYLQTEYQPNEFESFNNIYNHQFREIPQNSYFSDKVNSLQVNGYPLTSESNKRIVHAHENLAYMAV